MVDAVTETAKISEPVELAVGGTIWSGWTSVSVSRSLDTLSGAFELGLANRLPDGGPLPIFAGDACQLRIAGETVMDGFVDRVGPARSGSDAGISVSGRDRTADLADCSAIAKPGSWRNTTIEAIAVELARPFGVGVTAKTSTGGKVVRFALQQGETVQAAIERLLRFRGLLMQPTATGDLEIIAPDSGAPVLTLAIGTNVLSVSATHDHAERYSDYLVKGQAAGNDEKNGKTVSQIKGEARDPGVKRYRPLLIVAEEQGDGATLKARAKWEAGVRAGKSVSAEIDVLGWRVTAGGALWRPNMRVRVQCPAEQLPDETMLVSAVRLAKDDAGTIATLTVMPPEAWTQLADPGAIK